MLLVPIFSPGNIREKRVERIEEKENREECLKMLTSTFIARIKVSMMAQSGPEELMTDNGSCRGESHFD